MVEYLLGKKEVVGSIPTTGSLYSVLIYQGTVTMPKKAPKTYPAKKKATKKTTTKKTTTKKTTTKKTTAKKKAVKKKLVFKKPILKERMTEIDGAQIIEHPPTYRSLWTYGERKNHFFLYFPYVVHIIRKHKSYGGHEQLSLHVGFRTEPLPRYKKDIRECTLLYPPMSNVYCKWLLVCSPATVEGFWKTQFNGHDAWADSKLRKAVGLTFPSWEKIHPDDFMEKLNNWPKTIKADWGDDGLPRMYGSSRNKDMPCHVPFKDVMGKIYKSSIDHVDAQNRYNRY